MHRRSQIYLVTEKDKPTYVCGWYQTILLLKAKMEKDKKPFYKL